MCEFEKNEGCRSNKKSKRWKKEDLFCVVMGSGFDCMKISFKAIVISPAKRDKGRVGLVEKRTARSLDEDGFSLLTNFNMNVIIREPHYRSSKITKVYLRTKCFYLYFYKFEHKYA